MLYSVSIITNKYIKRDIQMLQNLKMRHAELTDAKDLYQWRTDPVSVSESLNHQVFTFESHVSWLKKTLKDPDRSLLIFIDSNGHSVGTGRADKQGSHYLLSWTVAPDVRQQGIGAYIVKMLVKRYHPSKALILESNKASIYIATKAGLNEIKRIDGIVQLESR